MKNNKNSNFLSIFAGLFLLVALLGGCAGNANTNTAKPNTSAANNSKAPQNNYASAPAGATPAHFKGGQAAKVVIEEFADYQCPTCATMYPTTQQIQAAYGERVKIIFRNFPLQMHPYAFDAAVAAEAAGMQGKFWEMQHQLFTNQKFWSNDSNYRKTFEDYAQKIGLDVDRFKADMAGFAAKERVDKDIQRARALNVGSTPTFFLNGREMQFAETEFNRFRQAIDAELQKAQSGGNQTAPAANTTPAAANTVGVNTSAANTNQTGANK